MGLVTIASCALGANIFNRNVEAKFKYLLSDRSFFSFGEVGKYLIRLVGGVFG